MSNTRLPQRQKDQHILKFFITLVQGELLGIFLKKPVNCKAFEALSIIFALFF